MKKNLTDNDETPHWQRSGVCAALSVILGLASTLSVRAQKIPRLRLAQSR